eukprot:3103968-Pleurochrysis_carterae.AAC.1
MQGQISDCRATMQRSGRMCSQSTRGAPPAVARIVLTMLWLGAAAIFLQKNSASLEIIYLRPLRCTK